MIDIDAVIAEALDTLLWTSHCNGTVPEGDGDHEHTSSDPQDCDASLDYAGYERSDFADKARAEVEQDVRDFAMSNEADIAKLIDDGKASAGEVGYNFILTRNHEGAGFWDRGWGEIGARLTEASHPYGSMGAYVGDDGKVYVHG
jgi:hypothetical protein